MASKIYRLNYRAQELRVHGTPNGMRFMADDATADAAATAIAAIVDGLTTAQRTSLTKRIHADGSAGTVHTTGTEYTAHGLMVDGPGAAWRFMARNWDGTLPDADLAALLTGTASGDAKVTALVTPPALPNSGVVVDHVSYSFAIKRY